MSDEHWCSCGDTPDAALGTCPKCGDGFCSGCVDDRGVNGHCWYCDDEYPAVRHGMWCIECCYVFGEEDADLRDCIINALRKTYLAGRRAAELDPGPDRREP